MKIILLATLFLLLVFFLPFSAQAHTLKIDGSFGITVHIDPDDMPIAGAESKIFVDIQDKNKQFDPYKPQNCDCIIEVQQDGKTLHTIPFVAGGMFTQPRYTFPQRGTYILTISGKYNGQGRPFNSFKASFDYFVDGKAGDSIMNHAATSSLQTYFPFIIIVAGLGIILIIFLPAKLSHKKNEKTT